MSLKQLCAELGLSKSTVSRALNGYSDVSEVTRKRVQEAADRLGYRPNPTAVKLVKGQAKAVGVVLPVNKSTFISPAFSRLLSGVTDALMEQDYRLMMVTLPDTTDELVFYQEAIRAGNVDGILVVRPRQDDPRLKLLVDNKFPFVLHGQHPETPCNWIDVDNASIFYQLTQRQLMHGHRRIACIDAGSELVLSAQRRQGYQQALTNAGMSLAPELLCHGPFSVESGYKLAHELLRLEQPPTAILCADDLIALGAVSACKDLGLAVGKDIAITGYGDYEPGRYSSTPLTTVAYDTYDVGRRMADNLLNQILRPGEYQPLQQLVSTTILPRASDDFVLSNKKLEAAS